MGALLSAFVAPVVLVVARILRVRDGAPDSVPTAEPSYHPAPAE